MYHPTTERVKTTGRIPCGTDMTQGSDTCKQVMVQVQGNGPLVIYNQIHRRFLTSVSLSYAGFCAQFCLQTEFEVEQQPATLLSEILDRGIFARFIKV